MWKAWGRGLMMKGEGKKLLHASPFLLFAFLQLLLFVPFHAINAQIATANNPHGKIKIACNDCHTTKGWSPLRLDLKFKHEQTGFALEGQHVGVACKQCHASHKFTGASKECKACHKDVHDGTLGKNCERCHTAQAWQDVSKIPAVHQASRFPLIGLHQHAGCNNCHAQQGTTQFINMPLQCGACHQKDFDAATNPNHRQAGFSIRCEQCHSSTITGWQVAGFGGQGFDHSKTRFPLLGAHVTTACNQCHVNNRYAGTPMDCYSCHQADFQRSTNPNHVTLNFARDCTACHTMNAWRPATFDHDGHYFRIYSGKHRGKWQSCATCHVNATNYKVFECILCHDHNQTKMDNKHRNRADYQYNSQACYKCHPRV